MHSQSIQIRCAAQAEPFEAPVETLRGAGTMGKNILPGWGIRVDIPRTPEMPGGSFGVVGNAIPRSTARLLVRTAGQLRVLVFHL